jgi:hypothetical protein
LGHWSLVLRGHLLGGVRLQGRATRLINAATSGRCR